MPITPLHFGLIPILNRLTRRRMSEGAFVLANVVADIPVMLQVYRIEIGELGGPGMVGTLHSVLSHHFTGALALGLALGLLGFKSSRWWMGCVLGTMTHVALDMFVHTDVQPFMPWVSGNPFYMDGAHAVLSVVLMVGTTIWILESLAQRRADRLKAAAARPAA